MAEQEEAPVEEGAPAWMATFADLSTLLLTFFVLLLSFANMDIVKFREMMGSMQDAFGYQKESFGNWNPDQMSDTPTEAVNTETGTGGIQADVETLIEVQSAIESQQAEDKVEAEVTPRGVVIRVKDSVMFTGGSDILQKGGHDLLNNVVLLLGKFPCEIMVEGHTDDRAMHSKRFPSNWELSSARAIAVMRYLAEIGGFEASRLGAAGFADTRPLVPNTSEANRRRNRRVEFVCVRDDQQRKKDAQIANEIGERARRERLASKTVDEAADDAAVEDADEGALDAELEELKALDGLESDFDDVEPMHKKSKRKQRRKQKRGKGRRGKRKRGGGG